MNTSSSDHENTAAPGTAERLLAVVAREHRRAEEVAASFAEAGDRVKTDWFASPEELLSLSSPGGYEAVIFYAAVDDAADVEERLRVALGGAAFFRVAA